VTALAALAAALTLSGRVAIVASSAVADGQTPLRYAERDADRMAEVLRELGGFGDVWTLHQPSARSLEGALDRAERLAGSDPQLQILVFYSGHADGQGVLLGGERVGYQGLRDRLTRSRAAVRVLLLDACNSGAAVRTKGGRPSAGFALEGAQVPVAGAAILTASTASELAQESSDIEGSYFTHHLLSGLRGAADRDDDGQVTLGEAYQYAASRTIAATVPSAHGPQHPAYEYQLAGTGELVLTRLPRENGGISFPPGHRDSQTGSDVRYFVTTPAHRVVAEVAPHPTRRLRLALPAGRYRVIRRSERRAFVAEVALARGQETQIEGVQFEETAPELALAKGRPTLLRNEVMLDVALSGLGPGLMASAGELGAGWMARRQAWSIGPHLSVGRASGALAGVDYRLVRWTASGLVMRRIALPLVELRLGGALGLSAIQQSLAGSKYQGLAPTALATAALDVPVRDWLGVRVMWGFGAELLKLNGGYQLNPEARAALATLLLF
jgi:hypothetical protein